MKSIVITGSSTGIGRATAIYFAKQGWRVAATMRNPQKESELQKIERMSVYALDVTKEASIQRAVDSIVADFGSVDVLLNNAGYGLMGAFEKASPEQIKAQFDTNVFGLMSVTKAFLPHFRERRSGMILNVSSIGGKITFPFLSLYHSTKWAIEGFSESLSYELDQFGIQVKLIEPGGVETDFSGRSLALGDLEAVTAYDEHFSKFTQALLSQLGSNRSSAKFVAERIYAAATDGKKQLRYLVGTDAEQMHAQRTEVGDDSFIAGMKQLMLS